MSTIYADITRTSTHFWCRCRFPVLMQLYVC